MRPLAMLLLLAACVTPPTTTAAPRTATPVTASFARTWDAIIDVFAEQNIAIRTIDRASGLVATDAVSTGAMDESWADCGHYVSGGPSVPTIATYNVLARGDSASSTVRVTVTWGATTPGGLIRCVSRGVWEGELERLIKAKAQATVAKATH